MEYLYLTMRWLHIIPAIVLVGGTIFMRVAVVPACNQLDEELRTSVQESVRRFWLRLLMPSIGFLIISGLVNTAWISMDKQVPSYYMPLLTVKLILAVAIFYIASLLAGRSEAAVKFRQRQQFWLNVNILLAILLICIAGTMKMTDPKPKKDAPDKKDPAKARSFLDPGENSTLSEGIAQS